MVFRAIGHHAVNIQENGSSVSKASSLSNGTTMNMPETYMIDHNNNNDNNNNQNVVWDKEDFTLEASNQLGDSNVHLNLDNDPSEHLQNIIDDTFSIIRERGDIDDKTLAPTKSRKKLNSATGRPVISNSGYFTEDISAFFRLSLAT